MAESATTDEALRLERVSQRIGAVTVVDDLSISVREGELVTLLGPSGCGKSTTLRIVAGYLQPTRGDVVIRGRTVTHLPPQARNIGMVFQSYALFPHLDVAHNVGFALSVRRRRRAEIARRVEEMLRLVQLEGFGDRMPSQLSGGQQQRIALARVLAFGPTLLLLDEPLSALDLKLREDMQGEIKRIQRELGITTVYVTHDQGEALHLSDRIAVMRSGRIEQIGTPDTIYRHPATRFVASFLGRMQFLDAHVLGVEQDRQVVELVGHGLRLACAMVEPMASGQYCVVGVRPERVRVSAADGAAASERSILGEIVERQYLGTHAQLTIKTAFGPPIAAIDHADRLVPGQRVRVSFDDADVTLFPDASPLQANASNRTPRDERSDVLARAGGNHPFKEDA